MSVQSMAWKSLPRGVQDVAPSTAGSAAGSPSDTGSDSGSDSGSASGSDSGSDSGSTTGSSVSSSPVGSVSGSTEVPSSSCSSFSSSSLRGMAKALGNLLVYSVALLFLLELTLLMTKEMPTSVLVDILFSLSS